MKANALLLLVYLTLCSAGGSAVADERGFYLLQPAGDNLPFHVDPADADSGDISLFTADSRQKTPDIPINTGAARGGNCAGESRFCRSAHFIRGPPRFLAF